MSSPGFLVSRPLVVAWGVALALAVYSTASPQPAHAARASRPANLPYPSQASPPSQPQAPNAPVSPAEALPQQAFRGVWLRPVANLTSATLQLDNIQKAGFSAVYLETFYHGFTLYPSHLVPIRPEMEGTDYLKHYLEEGHKRGLQIIPWIEVFYWQVDTTKYPQFPRSPLFDNHPDWKAILRDGKTTEEAEPAHIFANPANPDVRRFLVNYLEELLTAYPVDGLNLDYIRYPDGSPDAGYDDYTRNLFKQAAGVDPITIAEDPDNPQWRQWVEFREEQVLQTVWEIKQMKDRARKSAILSAAVFPGAENQRYRNHKFQNWRRMLSDQYLDAIAPMCYDYQLDSIAKQIRNVSTAIRAGSGIQNYPILAAQRKTTDFYSGQGHPPITQQINLLGGLGISGFSVFCYEWMVDSDEGLNLLKGNRE